MKKTSSAVLGSLPIALCLFLGCSDAGETGEQPGTAGTAAGTAGSATANSGGSASAGGTGSGSGVAGNGAGVAGHAGSTSGGSFNGASGSGTGGATGTSGAGPGGAGGMAAVPTDGKGLYDLNCKACHADQGIGSPLAPETQHPVRDYSTWVVRNGRAMTTFAKPMDKFGTDKLSDAQLNLIWDYLDQPPQATTGKGLYDDYCANCHGADGKGGPTTRNIVNEVQNVLKMVRSGKSVGQYAMRHDSMPAFSTARITDPQLTLIHDYVDSF